MTIPKNEIATFLKKWHAPRMQNQSLTQPITNPIQQLLETIRLAEMVPDLLRRIEALETTLLEKSKTEDVKEYYTIPEAAAILSISTRSVRRLVDRGILKRSFSVRHIRIVAESLKTYSRLTSL